MKMIITETIIPKKCILNNQVHKLTKINKELIIHEYIIELTDDFIIKDILLEKTKHPNCDPITNKFCLPLHIQNSKFNNTSLNFIQNMMEVFNLDSSYSIPWSQFEYENERDGFVVNIGGD